MTDRRSDRFREKGEYESKKKAKRGSKDESGEKDIKTDSAVEGELKKREMRDHGGERESLLKGRQKDQEREGERTQRVKSRFSDRKGVICHLAPDEV